ncbi:Dynein light chain Tctex-type [Binucleata daphniae]
MYLQQKKIIRPQMIVTINSEYLDIINGKNCKNGNKAVFERLRHNVSTASNINAAICENTEQKDDHEKREENMQPQMMIEAVQEYDASEVEQLHTVVNEKIADENNVKKDDKTDENTCTEKDNDNNANNILVETQNEINDVYIASIIADYVVITIEGDNERNFDVVEKTEKQESVSVYVQNNEPVIEESFNANVVVVQKEKADASSDSFITGCVETLNDSDDIRKSDVVCKTVQQESTKCVVQSNENIRDETISEHYKKAMSDRMHAEQQKEAHCPKAYVEYSSLSEEEKMKLAVFCCKKLRSMRKKGWMKKTVGWVRNVFSPKKDAYYCSEKVVNKSFYDLQNMVLEDAKNCNKIFRKSFDDSKAEQMLSCMLSAQPCKFDDHNTYDLVGMYKWYIRNVLNGLLPESITKALLEVGAKNIFKKDNYEQYKDVIKYLVFAIPEKQKSILKSIFAIFESVEINYSATEMDMKSLIICIAPSIFDSKFFKKIEHAKLAVEITGILYHCDYDKIDKNLYEEFCLYNKNK